MDNNVIIKMAQVESVEDEADGLRIKARLQQDGKISLNELPYAYPLLPKTIQSVPKVGEGVLILCSEINNIKSNRYYIGPLISQPQYHEYDSYSYGRGSAISLLQGKSVTPLERISNYEETKGSFPNVNDVAIVGRTSEDITLKDGELDLRCGIRKSTEANNDIIGRVIFNKQNPAYIKLKYKRGLTQEKNQEADSIISLVADKINLISHKDVNAFNLTDNKSLIKDEDYDNIMSKLHELPYGDILVDALTIIRQAIISHVHPYPGLPPCIDQTIQKLNNTNLNDILSTNVRIS